MKKTIILAIALCSSLLTANSQDIYNSIRSKSKAAVEAKGTDKIVKRISQFKVDALDYMMIKMQEQMPDSSTVLLDKQAYAMQEFVNFYIKKVLLNNDKSDSTQIKGIKMFMDASYSNPLFNDPDEELTLGYYYSPNAITRFSLNTDWRKALVAIKNLYATQGK